MKLEQLLSSAIKAKLRQTVYVPYCEHTPKVTQKCPHHCTPSLKWITHQKHLNDISTSSRKDSVDILATLLFGEH